MMLSGGVIVASCAASEEAKASSTAAEIMHFPCTILIMASIPFYCEDFSYTRNNWTRKRNGGN
jgi:hypothetical protein